MTRGDAEGKVTGRQTSRWRREGRVVPEGLYREHGPVSTLSLVFLASKKGEKEKLKPLTLR